MEVSAQYGIINFAISVAWQILFAAAIALSVQKRTHRFGDVATVALLSLLPLWIGIDHAVVFKQSSDIPLVWTQISIASIGALALAVYEFLKIKPALIQVLKSKFYYSQVVIGLLLFLGLHIALLILPKIENAVFNIVVFIVTYALVRFVLHNRAGRTA